MDKNKEKDRIQQMKDIITNGFSDKGSQYNFMKHDIKLFFGDMNYRIDLSYESVISSIESMTDENFNKKLTALLSYYFCIKYWILISILFSWAQHSIYFLTLLLQYKFILV